MKLLATLAAAPLAALLLSPATTPVTLAGCAMPLADNPAYFTLCQPKACYLLRGDLATIKLSGHSVKLRGTVRPASAGPVLTFDVTEVVELGPACHDTCTPSIPSRGLGGKDRPDGEGATPGRSDIPPPQ